MDMRLAVILLGSAALCLAKINIDTSSGKLNFHSRKRMEFFYHGREEVIKALRYRFSLLCCTVSNGRADTYSALNFSTLEQHLEHHSLSTIL